MGMAGNQIPPQVAAQMAQSGASGSGGKVNPQGAIDMTRQAPMLSQAAQGGMGQVPTNIQQMLAQQQAESNRLNSLMNTPDPALAAYQNQANQTQLTGQAANLYNQLGQLAPSMLQGLDKNAIAANPAGLQPMIQAAQTYNQMMQTPQGQQLLNNLPAGVDKYAVAANPAAYQQWQQQAKAQKAARPGSTMFAPQQNMPSSPQQMGPQMGIPSIPYSGINDPRFQQASNDFEKSLASARAAQQNMPSSPQGMGGKGGQPPSPQQLGQGLQQQAMMQRQMPLSNQRQPQGRLAGRTAPQVQNASRAVMGSLRR